MATILVIDDSPHGRYISVRTLERAGFEVREAATASQGRKVAMAALPDLIVFDIRLPDSDGFALCRELKREAATRAIPIILKTAFYKTPEHRAEGIAAGASAYLEDPVEGDVLLDAVRHLVPMGDALQRGHRFVCAVCSHSIPAGEPIVRVDQAVAHLDCFSRRPLAKMETQNPQQDPEASREERQNGT